MLIADKGLLERIARGIATAGSAAPTNVTTSLLAQAATSYGERSLDDHASTHPGFDPHAAVIYETIAEITFLVANAEGALEDDARAALQLVLFDAGHQRVSEDQLEETIADLAEQLAGDGLEKRARMVSRTLVHSDHQREGMRVDRPRLRGGERVAAPCPRAPRPRLRSR
jgi:hypothetical protein